jgi:N-methylhydantoinase A/oxoprolinase/acetone carboxylase beta subunit
MEQFKLNEEIPTERREIVKGKFNIKGEEVEKLDEAKLKEIGLEWKEEVDILAVSGYMSVRNPEHEIVAKEVLEKTTGLSVVCGHILTNKLNSIKRATTVTLNASLIPIIEDLNQRVKEVLQNKGINVPLLIVKGDGSLVKDKVIIERPIETILSGPAASIIGAKHLGRVDDGIIVDMGGTTTDICLIKDGYPELDPTGAIVGGWSSSIEAIKFKTIGLGGDSQIVVNEEGKLEIGPKRVIPYSIAAKRDKVILEELKKMKNKDLRICEREFLVLNRFSESISYSKQERKLLKLLESGPKSLKQLVEELDLVSFDFLETKRLEQLEVIKRILKLLSWVLGVYLKK